MENYHFSSLFKATGSGPSTARQAVGLLLVVGAVGRRPRGPWGDLGHKIVCQIAFQELNEKARAEVVRLIALDEKFDSFTEWCDASSRGMAPGVLFGPPNLSEGQSPDLGVSRRSRHACVRVFL